MNRVKGLLTLLMFDKIVEKIMQKNYNRSQ